MNQTKPPLSTSAVTVLLTDDKTAFIDEVAAAVRRNTGHSISRSAMIRAITTAVLAYYKDWLECRSEAEIQKMVSRRLQVGTK